ncbi:MAG: SBBP repeat-containing protein [Ignavibacteria bacterium]|nr:SBBP repeat-containing protein [Ignavibacteria bacterium]
MINRILVISAIALTILAFEHQPSFSQVTQEWVARYNGPGNLNDYTNSIAVDSSGNVYVTGHSLGSGTSIDYATIKLNSSGVQQWVARYNGPGNSTDRAYSIALDGSGNVYVTGYSIGSGTSDDYATIKYNSTGGEEWVARYNGPGNSSDRAYSIAVDGSGNVYVTGRSRSSGTWSDYATVKYNSSGVQQWVARYNGPGNLADYANSIAVDGSGNVYVTGNSDGSGTSDDYATVKYNSSGVQEWVARYNGPGNSIDYAYSIALDGSGNVYVTGYGIGSGTLNDYATVKYNSSGVQQWVARYNGPGNLYDYAYSLAVDGSGNVYVTGRSTGSGTSYDYATIKYNSSGVQQWVARYNGPENLFDDASSLAVDGSGNVYVTGNSSSGTLYDYATVKYNSSGVQQWVARYNGPGNSGDDAIQLQWTVQAMFM